MAFKVDPHLLIVMMRLAFWDKQSSFPRRLDLKFLPLGNGIRDDRATNVRTFPVLDAIASILVRDDEHEVFAVALQVDPMRREIRLTIAGNKGVSNDQVQHLSSIWRKLRTLSHQYEKARGLKARGLDVYEGDSPEIPAEVAFSSRVAIFREIYRYSFKKQMRRVDKWKPELVRFAHQFARQRQDQELNVNEQKIWDAVTGLLMFLQTADEIAADSEDDIADGRWGTMFLESMSACRAAQLALACEPEIAPEILAHEITGHWNHGPFQLRRALEKLTTLSRHIESLLSFAHSPRLRPAFLYNMSISAVPERTRTVPLPESESQWLSIIKGICGGGSLGSQWQGKSAKALLKKFPPPEKECPVHCECSLIEYLETKDGSSWDKVPPYNYIGVSKLSCCACHLWIEAFNELDGRTFFTKGSHGKWYWPWGMPEMGERIEELMVGKVTSQYLAYLQAHNHQRRGSDSSDADSAGAQPHPSDAQKETVESKMAAIVQRAGGTRVGFVEALTTKK